MVVFISIKTSIRHFFVSGAVSFRLLVLLSSILMVLGSFVPALSFGVSIVYRGSSLCINAPQTFEAITDETGNFSYQWQFSRNDGATWNNFISANESLFTLIPSDDFDNNLIRVVANEGSGNIFSSPFRLEFLRPPVITAVPRDTSICPGTSAFFTVAAIGIEGLNVQWQTSNNSGLTWLDVPAATSPSFMFTPPSGFINNIQVRAIVYGACTTITRTATLRQSRPGTITSQSGNVIVCEGGDTTLFVRTSIPAAQIEWERSVNGIFWERTGTVSPTLLLSGVSLADNGTFYRAKALFDCGDVVFSSPIRLAISPPSEVSILNEELDFGFLGSCRSSEQRTLSLFNQSSIPARYTASFGNSAFSLTSGGIIEIAPSQVLDLSVLFTPNDEGTFVDTLRLLPLSCGMPLSVPLVGSNSEISLTAEERQLAFSPAFACGQPSLPLSLNITNKSDSTVLLNAISLPATGFQLERPPSLPLLLQAGERLALSLTFVPNTAGTFSEFIRLHFQSGECSDSLVLPLSGTALLPTLSGPTTMLIEPTTPCVASAVREASWVNSSPLPLTISDIATTGRLRVLSSPDVPFTLMPDEEVSVSFSFDADAGMFEDTLRLEVAECSTETVLVVSGEVLELEPLVSVNVLNFGTLSRCDTSEVFTLPLSIANPEDEPVAVALQFSHPDKIRTDDTLFVLEPREAKTLPVTLLHTAALSERFYVLINRVGCSFADTVFVSGEYVAPSLAASPPSIAPEQNFGILDTTVFFINTSPFALRLSTAQTLSDDAQISDISPPLGSTLAAGDTVSVVLRLQPKSSSPLTDTLIVSTGDDCPLRVAVPLHILNSSLPALRVNEIVFAPGDTTEVVIELEDMETLPAQLLEDGICTGVIKWNNTLLTLHDATPPLFDLIEVVNGLSWQKVRFEAPLSAFPLRFAVVGGLGEVPGDSIILEDVVFSLHNNIIAHRSLSNGFSRLRDVFTDGGAQLVRSRITLLQATVFPNPVTEEATLRIWSDRLEIDEVNLINIQGQLVRSYTDRLPDDMQSVESIDITFTREDLPTGVYFFHIRGNNLSERSRRYLSTSVAVYIDRR